MSGRLRDRVAVVTGAGCRNGLGNGMAIARHFAREGASLLLVDRDPEALEATRLAATEEGAPVETLIGDVSDAETTTRIADRGLSRFGRIDVLVNNVGISSSGSLLDIDEADWDRCFAVNLRSVFLCTRAVIPTMQRQAHGRIINISSLAGRRVSQPPPHAYAASKAALDMLTRTIAAEFASQGIRCNAIVPGMIDTPMVRSSILAAGLTPDQAEAYDESRHRLSPTGRQGSPWDIANAALFLAGAESAYVNGTELVVDGGFGNLAPTVSG